MNRELNISVNTSDNYNEEVNNRNGLVNMYLSTDCNEVTLGTCFIYRIVIENNSCIDFKNVTITKKYKRQLKLLDVMSKYANIINVEENDEDIIIYTQKIKAREKIVIDISMQVVYLSDIDLISSYSTLEATYTDKSERKLILNSNKAIIKVEENNVVLRKSIKGKDLLVGERGVFSIIVQNNGNVRIENVIVRDMLNPELRFINDTVNFDDEMRKNASILSGINIGEIESGSFKEITFEVEVISEPSSGRISSSSLAEYSYKIIGENNLREVSIESNEVFLKIQKVNLDICKTVDKDKVALGQVVNYNIVIENTGSLDVKNIILKEIIDKSMCLLEGCFSIDNKIINNVDLDNGIIIGNLSVGESSIIKYKAKHIKTHSTGKIINKTVLDYYYKMPQGIVFKGKEIKEDIEITSTISNFKYVSLGGKIERQKSNPPIGETDNIVATVEITDHHLIKTIIGKSNEGQVLTGYKIVVKGVIEEIIEYTTNELDNEMYSITGYIPFSTFIVLPDNFKEGSKINIDYNIEDVSCRVQNEDCVYSNANFLLIAKVQSYMNVESNN